MKATVLLIPLLLAAVPAPAAPGASCIDPHKSYVARPLNAHDVYARTTLGTPRPAVRLATTCAHLAHANAVSLSSSYTCMGLGDIVIATTIDGRREACRISAVQPYVPDGNDLKQY